MPSITVSDGNTFKNWGPVTTTFTAPASCSTAGDFLIGNTTDFPLYDYATQCSTYGDYGCTPTGTFSPSLTIESNLTKMDDNIPYYSPGLYCPSGWATVGVAARDGDKTTSLSGILGVSTTTTTSDSWLDYLPKVGNPLTMLAELLDPGETLVMCCPSSMTADIRIGCYTNVSDIDVVTACYRFINALDTSTLTKTYDVNGTTSTGLLVVTTAPQTVSIGTTIFGSSQLDELGGMTLLPMLSLVHHQSDLKATGTAEAGSAEATSTSNSATNSNSATTSSSAATSNSAARAGPNVNSWDGLGAVLGVSLAAIVLGAAVVLQ
ncbi:hypothetical protein N7453_003384 [Penicillium expansum]|nr:hypothetical protein N7453_003384 [Penicillium expansum]